VRILIATGIYPPDIGGPATYSQLIAREFSKQGNNVAVICYSDRKSSEMFEVFDVRDGQFEQAKPGTRWCGAKRSIKRSDRTFKVIRISRRHNKLIRYFLYFWRLLKLSRDSNVIYAQGPINSGFPAALVSKILGKKFLLRLGGDYIWERTIEQKRAKLTLRQYYKSGAFKKQGLIFRIFKWVLKSTDLIIFSTEFQRDIYLKHLELKKEKTVIIKNAFSDPEEISRDLFYSNQILFAGRLVKLKNLSFLINAFSEVLSETNKNIQLRIIGDGPEKKRLQGLVKKLHLEKKVIFENKISHQRLLEKVQKCYFVVLPSLTEISPNLVLESIKLNKPILCTQETGFYEDFRNDLLFFNPCDRKDFLEKFRWLLNEQNYKRYQNKMKKISTKRSWSELAKEHLLIFKKLK